MSSTVVDVNPYGVPPTVDQKSGPFPLGQCLNKDSCATAFFGEADTFKPEKLSKLDASDSRMQQVYYADGTLWSALGTALSVGGKEKAGAAWYALDPKVNKNGVSATVVRQGYVGLLDTNLIYPAVAVNKKGQGVMAFTLVGPNNYPSAAYVGRERRLRHRHGLDRGRRGRAARRFQWLQVLRQPAAAAAGVTTEPPPWTKKATFG